MATAANDTIEIKEIKGIDLKKICEDYPEVITKISRLKAVLKDLYPEKQREINVLCDLHSCGVVKQMSKMDTLSAADVKRFASIMENQYGTMEKYTVGAVYLWSDALGTNCKAQVVHQKAGKSETGTSKPKTPAKKKSTSSSASRKKLFSSGDTIYKNKDIEITYQGFYKFDGLFAQGQRIRFVVENKTSRKIRVEGKNIVANGFVVAQGELFNSDIDPHRKVIDTVLMGKNKLDGAGIHGVNDVKELEIEFSYGTSSSTMQTTPALKLEPHIVQG